MKAETRTLDEQIALAIELTDENARAMIDCNSIPHQREGVRWMEVDLEDGDIARELRYLQLRGLLEFHPTEKNWLHFVEEK